MTVFGNIAANETLAAGGGIWELIARTELGSSASSFDFTSIPGTYDALMLLYSRATTTSTNAADWINMRFNGVTLNVYRYQSIRRPTSTGSPTVTAAVGTNLLRVGHCPGDSGSSRTYGSGEVLIWNYADTYYYKDYTATSRQLAAATADIYAEDSVGEWPNTAAVTQVSLLPGGGSFATGMRATLLGLKTS